MKFEAWRVWTEKDVRKISTWLDMFPATAGNHWCHLMSLIDQSCWSSKVDMEQATIGSLAWGHTVMTLMISSIMMVVGGDGCVMVCYSVQLARVRWCWKTYSWSKSYVKCIFFCQTDLGASPSQNSIGRLNVELRQSLSADINTESLGVGESVRWWKVVNSCTKTELFGAFWGILRRTCFLKRGVVHHLG